MHMQSVLLPALKEIIYLSIFQSKFSKDSSEVIKILNALLIITQC